MLYDNQIDFVTPPGYDSFTHFLNVTDVFYGLHIMNVPLMGLTPSISNITSSLWFSQSSCVTVLFVCMQRTANLITILNSIFFLTSQILKHLFYQCIFENMSFIYVKTIFVFQMSKTLLSINEKKDWTVSLSIFISSCSISAIQPFTPSTVAAAMTGCFSWGCHLPYGMTVAKIQGRHDLSEKFPGLFGC